MRLPVVVALTLLLSARAAGSGADSDNMFAQRYDAAAFADVDTRSEFYTKMLLFPDTGPADAAMVCTADKMGALFPTSFQQAVDAFLADKSPKTWDALAAVERNTHLNVSGDTLTKNARECVAANP